MDGLDLAAAGFERAAPKATGRPGYDPADLLKLYIYGYLNRVRSSRRLEAESKRNLEVIWLLRRLSPDFKTIADFRRINRAAFRQVFREFVRLCRELELFGRELVAVDGTRIKAVNSRERNFGLTPTPWSSGDVQRDQGIGRDGPAWIRALLVQIAWRWLRHQPDSALSKWFKERTAGARGRIRRVMIVALARKLLIALWRFSETGLVPTGAKLG